MAFDASLRTIRNPVVEGAAVVSTDGTVLAANMPPGIPPETLSIMCATIHGAGMTVSMEVRRENPRRIILESSEGRIVIVRAGRRALLVLVLSPDADLNRVADEMKPLVEEIARETG